MKIYKNIFGLITSPENLFLAWGMFKRDKRNKPDVMIFERNLEQNIFRLHYDLRNKTYKHGPYTGFWIRDPKLRHIHKASVRDRVLHHAIFKVLNLVFEPTLIPASYSCRIGKGSHKGMKKVAEMLREESQNGTKRVYALKCDIKKFFDSIDHDILLGILKKKIKDPDVIWLLEEIIESFPHGQLALFSRRGVPIGNLTSQLFANVYMNEFDQFVKHKLRVKRYARYTDDFIVISRDKEYLKNLLLPIRIFLEEELLLKLHPEKVILRRHNRGVDFLGYVSLPNHIVVRTKTKRRMLRKLRLQVVRFRKGESSEATLLGSLRSYLGILSHGNTHQLRQELLNKFWFWLTENKKPR